MERWCSRAHGEVSYFTTQFLTGHGSFGSYTRRIGKTLDDRCMYCGAADTAEHTVMECPRFGAERVAMGVQCGVEVDADNIVDITLMGKEEWEATMGMVHVIMERKEMEARTAQHE